MSNALTLLGQEFLVDRTPLPWLPPDPEWAPTNQAYHDDDRWGSTKIKTFRESPGLAWHYYIRRDHDPPDAARHLILGTLVHILLLEPSKWSRLVHVVPAGKTSKLFKVRLLEHPDKLVVPQADAGDALMMAQAIFEPQTLNARLAHSLLFERPIATEYSFRWEAEGVPLKVRFDALTETRKGPLRINFKTSRSVDPDAYDRHAFDLGYHRQEAIYERGFAAMTGGLVSNSLQVVLHNQFPYEVAIVEPKADFMTRGREESKQDLERLGQALQTPDRGCWAASWECGVGALDLPKYKKPRRAFNLVDTF